MKELIKSFIIDTIVLGVSVGIIVIVLSKIGILIDFTDYVYSIVGGILGGIIGRSIGHVIVIHIIKNLK